MITPAANIRRLVLPALDRTLSACASGISTLMLSPHAGHAPHQQSLLLVARFAGSKVTHRATSRRLTTRAAPDCFPPSPSKIPCATLFLARAIVFSAILLASRHAQTILWHRRHPRRSRHCAVGRPHTFRHGLRPWRLFASRRACR